MVLITSYYLTAVKRKLYYGLYKARAKLYANNLVRRYKDARFPVLQ